MLYLHSQGYVAGTKKKKLLWCTIPGWPLLNVLPQQSQVCVRSGHLVAMQGTMSQLPAPERSAQYPVPRYPVPSQVMLSSSNTEAEIFLPIDKDSQLSVAEIILKYCL